MRNSWPWAPLASAASSAKTIRSIAFPPPGLGGHYAIAGDPVVIVLGDARLGAEALAQVARRRKVLQHLVRRAVGEAPGLVGVALGVAPRKRRARALDIAVVHEGHNRARFEPLVQSAQKSVRAR